MHWTSNTGQQSKAMKDAKKLSAAVCEHPAIEILKPVGHPKHYKGKISIEPYRYLKSLLPFPLKQLILT